MVNYMYAYHLGEVCEQETLNTNSTSRYYGQLMTAASVGSGQLPRSAQGSCLGQLRAEVRKSWFIAIRLCSMSQQVQFAVNQVREVSETLNYLLSFRFILTRKLSAQLNGLVVFSFFSVVLKRCTQRFRSGINLGLSMKGLPSHSRLFTIYLLTS